MCSAPLEEARKHCTKLTEECEAVRDKFIHLFTLFSRCHLLYSQNEVERIDYLGKTVILK